MIRLARTGKTKQAFFRLIVSEKTKDSHGDYLELLGQVDPHANPRAVTLKTERVKYWLDHGAQPSPTVHNLLVDQGLLKSEKVRAWKPKKKTAEEVAKAAEAAKAPEAQPSPVAAEVEPAADAPAEAAPPTPEAKETVASPAPE